MKYLASIGECVAYVSRDSPVLLCKKGQYDHDVLNIREEREYTAESLTNEWLRAGHTVTYYRDFEYNAIWH